MKVAEVRALSDADLQKRLADSQQELFNLRFQLATRQLENVRRVREVRKDIARLRLIAGERERAAAQ
jgi:large subunit ribosomal protein L29